MILRILASIGAIFVAIIVVLILVIIVYAHLESSIFDDFVSGNAGDIEKVIIKSRFGDRTLNDKMSMVYLRESFKTLREANCSDGHRRSIFIYYKNRPIIYTEIFINGESPDKACLWINGSDGLKFEFDLQKPFPDGIKDMINYLNM